MWARNGLFLFVVIGGFTAIFGGLFPHKFVPASTAADGVFIPDPILDGVVDAVNHEFQRQWSEQKVKPAPAAPGLAAARRLSLALMGTIPSLQEIRLVEANPPADRLGYWLDHILHDRRSADYLAERLARVYVGTEEGPFIFYRRRRFVSWLGDQVAANRPYHHIVRDLIAGEGLWTDHPATNFVTVTIEMDKNAPNPERLAARVARAFLGIRMDCAQCHNHPFQKWKQSEFQELAAYFGQVHQGFTGLVDGAGDYRIDYKKTGNAVVVEPAVAFSPNLVPAEGTQRERLAGWVTDPKNPALARATVNRFWALMVGRPLVEPVDDLGSVETLPRALELLAADFAAHDYDLQRLIRIIARTQVFQMASVGEEEPTEAHEKAWALFPLTRLRPEQVVGAVLQSASLETLNQDSPIMTRFFRAVSENEFVKRYGDTGEDDFSTSGGTIPQRLLLLNGNIVNENSKDSIFNSSSRIAMLAPDDRTAVETAYLTVLTRRPTPDEATYFEGRLAGTQGEGRSALVSDLIWTLINSTEFSWNH